MQYNRVEICGVDTGKLPVLSEECKMQLLAKAQSGDRLAREQLINGNLRLVLSAIQRFSARGETADDLFQVGCIGLIKAIDRFNLAIDVRFSTYAVPMILGELRRYMRDNGQIRVARSIRDTAYHAMQAKENLQIRLQREPTVDEISAEMEKPREEVVMALESIVEPVSIHEPMFADGGDTVYIEDQLGDRNNDKNWCDEISMKEVIRGFDDREKRIVQLRFLQGMTQVEVAKEIGISQAQVSRLEKGVLNKIKEVF